MSGRGDGVAGVKRRIATDCLQRNILQLQGGCQHYFRDSSYRVEALGREGGDGYGGSCDNTNVSFTFSFSWPPIVSELHIEDFLWRTLDHMGSLC